MSSEEDVLAAYPLHVRQETDAPVRDAIVAGQTGMFLAYQEWSAYAAAQSDPTRATGVYLDGHCADARIYRQEIEIGEDERLRDRLFAFPSVVTPEALKALINQVLAPYTTKQAQIFESVLDRWFITDGTAPLDGLHSFITDGSVSVDPSYADRRYTTRPQSSVGGLWVFGDRVGRYLIVRIPSLNAESAAAFSFDGTQPIDTTVEGLGWFISDGTVTSGQCNAFIFNGTSASLAVYQAIVNIVQQAKGQGLRFQLLVDPKI